MKIVHLGMDHRADDVRIAYKECKTLAAKKHEVSFITLAYPHTRNISNHYLEIIELNNHKYSCSRLKQPLKYLFFAKKNNKQLLNSIYNCAAEKKAEVYHIHEYSLLEVGIRLKKNTGAKIIYDIHEDYPKQLEYSTIGRSKVFLLIKKIQSLIIELEENNKAKKYDYLICATPHIYKRFNRINRCEVICNYPILEKNDNIHEFDMKSNYVCYVGSIFKARGISVLIQSIDKTKVMLKIAGSIKDDYLQELTQLAGWKKTIWLGFQDRKGVKNIIENSLAGIVTLLPYNNYLESLPVKMFEYMKCGIPVIASNFPLFKKIVLENKCGICVDPCDIDSLSKAITYLAKNRKIAQKMGENGYKAVKEKYNWNIEGKKLLKVYNVLNGEINNEN